MRRGQHNRPRPDRDHCQPREPARKSLFARSQESVLYRIDCLHRHSAQCAVADHIAHCNGHGDITCRDSRDTTVASRPNRASRQRRRRKACIKDQRLRLLRSAERILIQTLEGATYMKTRTRRDATTSNGTPSNHSDGARQQSLSLDGQPRGHVVGHRIGVPAPPSLDGRPRGQVVGHGIGEPAPPSLDGRPRGHVVGHRNGEPLSRFDGGVLRAPTP